MNTDQAFDLLKDAGVTESINIQTVRRWLRESKINYEGTSNRKTGYLLDDTDQAFDLLKDAGVTESIRIQIVKRWLHEGKIKTENGKTTKLLLNDRTDEDRIIRQLRSKIKAQDKQLESMEELHEAAIKKLNQQRDQLNKECVLLKNENSNLQSETRNLLKENLELRDELIKLKDKRYKENKSYNFHSTPKSDDYSQKLGLSKLASNQEVLIEYKKLLKLTHPDQGGNAKTFQYIKSDYDHFRNSIKR
ncbi:hypothetical protein NDK43_30300 [Neobacillus pocheonensis]|uniref:J domain-containing protein n=1 Tax=Neobacillus pocheonensis TaxID=363869 RepID=A0ABT0WHJ3_9BACI|nr:hypothetical protein [Neobacillus pocheonensis]